MPSRKRTSQGEDAQQLPLREKRRKTQQADDEHELEDSLSHIEQPIAKRGLRSNREADVPIRLNNAGSPELAKSQPASTAKKSHVRFGSESPAPTAKIEENVQEADGLGDEGEDSGSDSDDDAPEAISHSHAEAVSKSLAAEAEQMLKQREQGQKEKRRKRDEQMKAQVKKSEKRRRQAEDEKEETTSKKPKFDLENLPNFLPEELLAIEAPVRPPTPEFGEKKSKVKKLKGLGKYREERAPADVVHNGTKIRALPKTNNGLPPKVSAPSRNVKQQWMTGSSLMSQKRGSATQFRRRAGPTPFA